MPRGRVLPAGERIAELRGEADLTQCELARAAGYGLRTIGKIEAGLPTSAGTLAAVAEVLADTLKRPVPPADLLQRREANGSTHPEEGDGVVEQVIHMLDLTQQGPAPCACQSLRGRAVLFDHYRFRRVPPSGPALTFYYATTGKGIEAHCVSHPQHARWQETTRQAATESTPARWRHSYQMHVNLPGDTAPATVENRLEYVDAFQVPDREWFQTHVLFPTDRLSMVVRLPAHKPGRAVHGKWKCHPTGLFEDAPTQPVHSPDGQLAYWHVPAPRLGATYQLEWRW